MTLRVEIRIKVRSWALKSYGISRGDNVVGPTQNHAVAEHGTLAFLLYDNARELEANFDEK